jgi:hypothetical protein
MAKKLQLKKQGENSCNATTNKYLMKAKLALYLKRGLDLKDAVKLAGISEFQLGQLRTDPDFDEFIDKCQVQCEHDHLKNIEDAGKVGSWQASSWYLERKFPDKYGKKDTVKHEYQLKIDNFKAIIVSIINEFPPQIRQMFMQKLRSTNIDGQLHHFQMLESGDKDDIIDASTGELIINSIGNGV